MVLANAFRHFAVVFFNYFLQITKPEFKALTLSIVKATAVRHRGGLFFISLSFVSCILVSALLCSFLVEFIT